MKRSRQLSPQTEGVVLIARAFLKLYLLGIACLGFTSAADAQQPVKIRIAWAVAPAQIAPIMLDPPGVARHNGKSYVLEPIRMPGSALALQALAAGEIDIANMAFNVLGPAILNAGMTDIRIIGDEFRDGVDDFDSTQYLVLKDGPINSIADMKGKVFATNGIGGGQDIFARFMFRKHGLEYPKDYTIIETSFPTMKAMLLEKKADMVVGVKPFTEDLSLKNAARTLFTQKDAVGPTDSVFLVARTEFIQKNRAALVNFFEDYIRAIRWFKDPTNQAAVVEIVSKFTKVPPQHLQWIFTKQDYYRDPNGLPDVAAIQRQMDMLKEFKFLKANLDVQKFTDLSLVEEAAARLK
jgi:NitT/TauT family transport system substrate-binding protein